MKYGDPDSQKNLNSSSHCIASYHAKVYEMMNHMCYINLKLRITNIGHASPKVHVTGKQVLSCPQNSFFILSNWIIQIAQRNVGSVFKTVTLLLITTATPTSSSSFEFTALGTYVRFRVTVWNTRCKSKVFHSFPGITTSCWQTNTHCTCENFPSIMRLPCFVWSVTFYRGHTFWIND